MSTKAETRERPIIFSGPMVRAIIDGRKTQTRRVLKPQPKWEGSCWLYGDEVYLSDESMEDHLFHEVYGTHGTPYGSMYEGGGDRIWVCEKWTDYREPTKADVERHRKAFEDVQARRRGIVEAAHDLTATGDRRFLYAADFDAEAVKELKPWKPSIPMPRVASRITLEITDVRVERLQSITTSDIKAEGVIERYHQDKFGNHPVSAFDHCAYTDPLSIWVTAWNQVNGKRPGCTWADSPWVWIISFKRIAP